ncbi:MAG: Glycosyltransferase [Ignavibacteriae bacterium]|nr:MAG: Glycosyltransferase [Ignavibacteriota bacterium]
MSGKINILFTSTLHNNFIIRDKIFFEKNYNVFSIIEKGIPAIIKILSKVPKVDLTFTWFASTYSFLVVLLTKIFKKKSFIVVGGVDVADYREINYGIWLNWWKGKLVGYSIRNATKVLAVDPSLIVEAKRLAKYDGNNLVYLPTGYDPEEWFPEGAKEKFVLSVGACEDEWRFVKKGFDKLIEAAQQISDVKFVIIGISESLINKIKTDLPQNIELIKFVSQKELLRYYQKAKVYCQVSYTEGLPNALCEAMLCGCIPVGTNRGGIPTAIDNAGFIVEYGNIPKLVDAIKEALSKSEEYGILARNYIIQNFHKSRRESQLIELINQTIY